MPVNRSAYERYLAYDRCFQKMNRSYTIRELMREINPPVSRAMFYIDIGYMRSEEGFKAPVVSLMKNGEAHYTYSEPGFSIVRSPISEGEKETLTEAVTLLSRSSGLPGFEWTGELLLRLNQTLDPGPEKAPVMVFESNPKLEGIELLSELYRFVSNKLAISVRYKPFFEREKRFHFHPYLMKQYNQRWYLAGWNAGEDCFNLLAVDRIVSVKASKIPYLENSVADFEKYFKDVVGVTVPGGIPCQEVVLAVDPAQYPYISTKPIHPSQIKRKTRGKNGAVIITLQVIPNYELESLLLSFSPGVEVLEPLWLREKLAGKLASALRLYTERGDVGRFSNLSS